ncbi:MAG: type II toxin-antitoxin system HicA family toxin [Dehalococcoidia bacterium]|nr:type II toxin-antitoxin system HicA family toxin [Dehalococcoidia bacterium]
MSPQLRNVRARQIVTALERDGFQRTHQTGSHTTYRRGDRKVMVPVHSPGATIPVGTIARIVADAGWTDDDLRRLRLVK